jgi:glycosyltransferase involved in cell wall biosynthesis
MKGKARVHLVVPSFMPHDAVGNDILGMYETLRLAGHDVRVIAPDFHESFGSFTEPLRPDDEQWQSPDDLLIYHHAVGWEPGEALLDRTRNKIAIKYHNITPPAFYEKYSRDHYNVCVAGELATTRLAHHRTAMFWGASRFNTEGLIAYGAPRARCRWIAPFHRTEELKEVPMDAATLASLRDGRFNILFVGGFRPNKGHANALQVMAAYREIYGSDTRMILAGSYDPSLTSYFEDIQRLVQGGELESHVDFARSVSAPRLKALYYAADAFLCVSEHEGFCVPLVEAMALRVPILALARTAVQETMGNAGILYDEFDPVRFAESLEQLRQSPPFGIELANRGRERYETEFHPETIGHKFLDLIGQLENGE